MEYFFTRGKQLLRLRPAKTVTVAIVFMNTKMLKKKENRELKKKKRGRERESTVGKVRRETRMCDTLYVDTINFLTW